jgi:ferredoxin
LASKGLSVAVKTIKPAATHNAKPTVTPTTLSFFEFIGHILLSARFSSSDTETCPGVELTQQENTAWNLLDFCRSSAVRTNAVAPCRWHGGLAASSDGVSCPGWTENAVESKCGSVIVRPELESAMAVFENKYPDNVAGKYYVDDQCIDCDLCRETAPDNFTRNEDGGYSYIYKQPTSPEEETLCKEAMEGCPVEAIGNDGEQAQAATVEQSRPQQSQ